MTMKQRNERVIGRWTNSMRPIPKKLWIHKVVSFIRVSVGAITFATMVFAGYYGLTAWLHQKRTVSEASLRRVEAEVVQYNDLSKRWTDSKVTEMATLPTVDFGYPRKDVTVQLTVDGKTHQLASMEGIIGREPELQNANLVWGESVTRESKPTVVLPQRFFERLGGRLTDIGPEPADVTVIVARVVDDTTETQRIQMRVAGLLRRDTDKIYAPLDLTINLDRFQTHKSQSPLGDSRQSLQSLVTYDHVDAYVPKRLEKNVADEEAAFNVRAERVGEVETVESAGEMWAMVLPRKGESHVQKAAVETALGQVQHESWPMCLLQLGEGDQRQTYLGLRGNDPRWHRTQSGIAPKTGELVAAKDGFRIAEAFRRRYVALRTDMVSLTGIPKCDAVGTQETLQWMQFDVESTPNVTRQTCIEVADINLATRLNDRYPGAVKSDKPNAWAMFDIEFNQATTRPQNAARSAISPVRREFAGPQHSTAPITTRQETRKRNQSLAGSGPVESNRYLITHPAAVQVHGSAPVNLEEFAAWLRNQIPDYEYGIVRRGLIDVESPSFATYRFSGTNSHSTNSSLTSVRVVPTKFFNQVVGKSAWEYFHKDSLPCVLIGPKTVTERFQSTEIDGRVLRPLRHLPSTQTEIWFPAVVADSLAADTSAVGLVAFGPWLTLPRLQATTDVVPNGFSVRQVMADAPQRFWLFTETDANSARQELQDNNLGRAITASTVFSLPVTVRQSGHVVAQRVCMSADRSRRDLRDNEVLVADSSGLSSRATITAGNRRFDNLIVRQDSHAVPGYAQVAPGLFRQLAFEFQLSHDKLPELPSPVLTVRLPDVHALRRAERRLADAGYALQPLVRLNRSLLAKYAVRSTGPADSVLPVPSSKATQMVMAQPTFRTVIPRILVDARIADVDATVTSTSGSNDPLWFEAPLIAGGTRTDHSLSTGICLTSEIATRAFPNLAADELIGRMVRVRVGRKDAVRERDVSLMMKVVGVADSPNCVASLQNTIDWRLWQDGKLVYDTAGRKFRTPGEVYDQRGFITAVFYASSDTAVRPLVEHLESLGCEVNHQLDDQDRLTQLAIAVATLVILFVSGSILNASANSGAISWMDLSTKFREIGVKMAYGVTRADIAFAYLAEGFLVGLLACLCGALLVVSTDTLLRDLIHQTIGLGSDFFIVPIHSLTVAWLYGIAAIVVIAFNMVGTLIPTWLALRKSPIELMK